MALTLLLLTHPTHGAGALQLDVKKGPPVTLAITGEQGSVVELQYSAVLGPQAQWSATDTVVLQSAAAELRPAKEGYFRAVSRDPAPTSLQAGETYFFSIPQGGMSETQVFLVLDSPTGGQLLRYANTLDSTMQSVKVRYLKLGPLAARFEVLLDNPMGPATNTYTLVYADRTSGWCQESRGMPPNTVGIFRRDTSMIGQTVLPEQPQPGEMYRFRVSDGPTTTEAILAFNTPGTAMVTRIGSTPDASIQEADVRYKRLGPLTAQFEVLTSVVMAGMTNAYTNLYTVAFVTADGGWSKVGSSDMFVRIGTVERITNLVGQTVAPPASRAGDTYRFSISDAASNTETSLVFNTPSEAMVVQPGTMPGSGILQASVDYRLIGPLASSISVVLPDNMPELTYTNRYTLMYVSPQNGWCELADRWGTRRVGVFTFQPWSGRTSAP